MKAADISEEDIHAVIAADARRCPSLWAFYDALRDRYPEKVILARLRALVKSKKISAQCTCGCKGPYCENDRPSFGGMH